MSETTSTAHAADVSEKYLAAFRECLRLTSKDFDGELADLICAARGDLSLGGVLPEKAEDEEDPLIKRAITTYVRAEFGLDNEDAERYRESYRQQKTALALASDYIEPQEPEEPEPGEV